MSLDRSLKSANSLERHRNVLTRAERIERLKDQDRWQDTRSVFKLPKVANRKAAVGAKAKAKTPAKEAAPTAAPAKT